VGHRLLRVNEAIKEAVSRAVTGEVLKDQRLGFITVTGVETTPDLRQAKVFVSVLGGEEERARSLQALRSSHGVIQSCVAQEVRLKRTPHLEFIYDDTTDKALRISGIIDRYVREHPEPPSVCDAGEERGQATGEQGFGEEHAATDHPESAS